MASGKNTTTTTSSNSASPGAQRALDMASGGAVDLYSNSRLNPVYQGQTYVNRDSNTQSGLNEAARVANLNTGGMGLSGQYQNIINQGGYNTAQLGAMSNMNDVANSQFDINSDPGFAQVVDQARDSVNSSISGAGRYGSGAHTATMGNTIGDLGARQYQNWQQRRDNANTNVFNMGQQGQNNIGSAFQGLQQAPGVLQQVGKANEDYATLGLNDALRIWNETATQPQRNVEWLNAMGAGQGNIGGSQVSSQSSPGQNPFLTAAGYGLSGLGLFGGM